MILLIINFSKNQNYIAFIFFEKIYSKTTIINQKNSVDLRGFLY